MCICRTLLYGSLLLPTKKSVLCCTYEICHLQVRDIMPDYDILNRTYEILCHAYEIVSRMYEIVLLGRTHEIVGRS